VGFAIVILLLLAFTLLWALTYYFFREPRFVRLAICFGFLIVLMKGFLLEDVISSLVVFLIVSAPMFALEWATSRQTQ
jgi:hypothetical protein